MLWIAPPLISVSRCSLGSLPRPKRGRQAAHAARSAWQHSCLFARGTRENPRDSRLRPTAGRTRIHLPHGSRLPGLPTAVPAAPGAGFLHHPRPQRLPLPPRRCPCGGQNYRPALRPDHSVAKFLYPQILSRAAASHSLPRRGEREELGVSDQQLPAAHADHRTTVPVPLASRAVLQVDQATSAHPEVLRPFAQRGEDATLDCHLRLRAGGDCSQAPGLATQPLPHDTNSQPHIVRKSAAFTGLFANTRRKRTRPLMQPAATVRLITGHLWPLTSLHQRLVKTGGRLVKHARILLVVAGRERQVSEKSLQNKAFSGFPLPGRGGTRPYLRRRSRLRTTMARAEWFGCIGII